jgi:hypothetical protein
MEVPFVGEPNSKDLHYFGGVVPSQLWFNSTVLNGKRHILGGVALADRLIRETAISRMVCWNKTP